MKVKWAKVGHQWPTRPQHGDCDGVLRGLLTLGG
jgi:hypothetical protein